MRFLNLMFLFVLPTLAQPQETFNKRYHFGFPTAKLSGVIPTDSCFYGMGMVTDTLHPNTIANVFVKFDLGGGVLSSKVLTDPDKWHYTYENAFVKTHDGNFAAAGITLDSIRRVVLIKYTPGGDTLFTRLYTHPLYPEESFLYLFDLCLAPDGGFVMAGNIENPAGVNNTDAHVLKTDSLGFPLGERMYGQVIRNDFGTSVACLGDGGLIVGGGRNNTNVAVENYTMQGLLARLDGGLADVWEYFTPSEDGLYDRFNDFVMLADGSFVIATGKGTELDNPSVNTVWFEKHVVKLGPDMETEWEITFEEQGLNAKNRFTNIVEVSDGSGVVLAGADWEPLPSIPSNAIRGYLAKVSLEGEVAWTRKYVGINTDNPIHEIYDIDETTDGGFIVCGESQDGTNGTIPPQQGWLLKLDKHGCLVPGCHLNDNTVEEGSSELLLSIYPNPTSDYLNFQLRGDLFSGTAHFRILDAHGKTVQEFDSRLPSETHIVPVWEWAAGVYFLQYIKDGEVVAVERFVVVK